MLEVGCGTGLLACIAARLGARQVYAVEPTPLVDTARALVRANGLEDRVTVLQGCVQDLAPRPVDLAFSELLNAAPFQEQVLDAMQAAADWGPVEPHRLRVYAALVRDPGSADEKRDALTALRTLSQDHDLDLNPILQALAAPGAYRHLGMGKTCGPPTLVYDLSVGSAERPQPKTVMLQTQDAGPIGGAMVWFEADYGPDLVLSNPPGSGGHWGQLICGWPDLLGLPEGGNLPVQVALDEGLSLTPL